MAVDEVMIYNEQANYVLGTPAGIQGPFILLFCRSNRRAMFWSIPRL